ncbi:hypothetical protein HanXRQr2_Chr10g0426931 [Helianthus annuus]|uniref:Uncharacterized protein n=1 Tax=Helianthus annuus TaxID=4232 RepID=A0A251TI22_HELAN|nr:hypothetical protein HanXRQr2_Chr10g0426931 [Helianthus annuus]KAJ0882669.1 hypothetical protein HanPSC8_Chr10g0412351 [Helianthus annuus]
MSIFTKHSPSSSSTGKHPIHWQTSTLRPRFGPKTPRHGIYYRGAKRFSPWVVLRCLNNLSFNFGVVFPASPQQSCPPSQSPQNAMIPVSGLTSPPP